MTNQGSQIRRQPSSGLVGCYLIAAAIAMAVLFSTILYAMIGDLGQLRAVMPALLGLNILVVTGVLLLVWSLFRIQIGHQADEGEGAVLALPTEGRAI